MPASYVERLIWKFVKEQILEGFLVFFSRPVLPVTLTVCVIVFLEWYFKQSFFEIPIITFILIAIGIIGYKRTVNIVSGVVLSAVFILYFVFKILLDVHVSFVSRISLFEVGILMLLGWFIFNSSMLIIQLWEFFASTAGLYLFLGSDKKRIFLSPLPQILAGISIPMMFLKVSSLSLVDVCLIILPLLSVFIALYGITKNWGRIVRGGLSIYLMIVAYSLLGYIVQLGAVYATSFWTIISILSLLFSAQKYSRTKLSESKKYEITYFAYAVVGIILLAVMLLFSPGNEYSLSIIDWWRLSLVAVAIAPIVSILYIHKSGRLEYYMKRDSLSIFDLIKESIIAVGRVSIEEIKKVILRKFSEFFMKFES